MKNLIYSSALILFLIACKSGSENLLHTTKNKNNFVSAIKPFEDLEIKDRFFEINANEKTIIPLKNGGQLEFPENAFVDQEGNQIQGKVTIEWKEFHSLTDVILSGIPMKHDSAGVENDFVSGGMFTINASQKGKELELAPNKKAKIDLASIQDTPCFSFYKLDEEKGNWDYKLTKNGAKNPDFSKKEETQGAKKEMPLLIDADVNTSKFPELQNKNIVAWKTNDKINRNHFAKYAQSAQLKVGEKPNEYVLEIKDDKKVFEYHVEPYTMEEAKKNSKEVEQVLEKSFSEELKFQDDLMTGKIIRSVEIESLGTYNWDAILHIENHISVLADLSFPNHLKKESVSLFFVCPELNATIRVNTSEAYPQIKFDAKKDFCLIGILSDNSIVKLKKEQVLALKKSQNLSKVKLNFAKTGQKIKNGADLEAFISESI